MAGEKNSLNQSDTNSKENSKEVEATEFQDWGTASMPFKGSSPASHGESQSVDALEKCLASVIEGATKNEISSETFKTFATQLNQLKTQAPTEHKAIIKAIITSVQEIYALHQQEIEEAIKAISENQQGNSTTQTLDAKYFSLLNVYHLAEVIDVSDLPFDITDLCHYHLAFAINALTLTGKLPGTGHYGQVHFGKALYPKFFRKDSLLPEKKGIKKSENYFLIKKVRKIHKGDTGDKTFLASDGKKLFYVRGATVYAPNAVLASKIATLVSKTHFSSERLLDNQFAASRKLEQYAVSAVHDTGFRAKRGEHLTTNIVPGTGIIDETLNYLQEADMNAENYGFSSENLYKAHLTKIDFDRCELSIKIQEDQYDVGMVTKHGGVTGRNLYKGSAHVQTDQNYLQEKYITRLKLSLLPQKLIANLAEKAYRNGVDDEEKKRAIDELNNRSQIALDLLLKDQDACQILIKNPNQLAVAVKEIAIYVARHFSEEVAGMILADLKKRSDIVRQSFGERNFNFVEPKLEIPASSSVKTTRMLRVSVDIDQYAFPDDERSNFDVSQEGELLFGDLHANGLKLFWLLNYHNVFTTTQSDYEKIKEIYHSPDLLNPNNPLSKRKQIIAEFDRIIDTAKIKDVKVLLVFIGDELGDRGANDYFVLKIFEKLHRSSVQFDVLLSNHGLTFLRGFMEGSLNRQALSGSYPDVRDQSKLNLAKLIDEGVITQEKVNYLVKECYLPHLMPAAFALDNGHALFSTHAPVGKDAIDAMVKRLGIQTNEFPSEWKQGEELAAKVEIGRELFQVYLKSELLFDELINKEYEAILGGLYSDKRLKKSIELSEYVFEYLAWSRNTEFTPEQRPEKLDDGRDYATVHGHYSGKPNRGTAYNTDNILGKSPQVHKSIALCTSQKEASFYTAVHSPQKQLAYFFDSKNREILTSIIAKNVKRLNENLSKKIAEKSVCNDLKVLCLQAVSLRNNLKESTINFENAFSSIKCLQKKFETLKKLKEDLQSIKGLVNKIQEIYVRLTQSLDKIPVGPKRESIKSQIQNYFEEFSDQKLATSKLELNLTIAELNLNKNRYTNFFSENKKLKVQLTNLEAKCKNLEKENAEFVSEIKQAQQKNTELPEKLEALQKESTAANKSKLETAQANPALTQTNQKLTEQIAQLTLPPEKEENTKNRGKNSMPNTEIIDDVEQDAPYQKFSDLIDTSVTADVIEKAKLNGDQILKLLEQIGKSERNHTAELSNDAWIKKQKARAVLIVENSLGALTLSEVLKLHALVEHKHSSNNHAYGFLRKEQDVFRLSYGNTNTWQKIMEAIKARLTNLAPAVFDKLHSESKDGTSMNPNLKSEKTKFCELMETHTVHDYGFGVFRPATVSASVKEKIEQYKRVQRT